MEKPNTHRILEAYYSGKNPFPYPTIKTDLSQHRYAGYFKNENGDKWVFLYDPELGGGVLLGSDCDWEPIPLGNGSTPVADDVVLDGAESHWLLSCWIACADLRKEETGTPSDTLTLGLAAAQWRIQPGILKTAADEGRLLTVDLGNVQITTRAAMTALYGTSRKKLPITLGLGKEIDEMDREVREEIRKKLMEM